MGVYPIRGISNEILLDIAQIEDITNRRESRDLRFLQKLFQNKIDVQILKDKLKFSSQKDAARSKSVFYINAYTKNVVINA